MCMFFYVDVLMQLYVYCIHVHEVLVYQASPGNDVDGAAVFGCL